MSNRFITCTAAILIAALPSLAQAPVRNVLMMDAADPDMPPGGLGGDTEKEPRVPAAPPAPPPALRATRLMDASDPNLDAGWQWWRQDEPHTVYFSPFGQTPQSAQVSLPWYTDGNILKGYDLDIYPEDGWALAFKEFGTPAQAPQFPYFVLYNKYRGKFRLMLYKPYQQNSTHYMAELKFMNDVAGQPRSTALLTFRADEKSFLNDYNPTQVDSCIASMNVYGGWGVFDFDLAGYDPKLEDPTVDPIIQVAIRGVNMSKVSLNSQGSLTLDQVLGSASLSTTRDENGNLAEAVTKGTKYYKDVKGFQGDLRTAIADPKNQNEWWLSMAKDIAPMALTAFAPYAGALAGFASAFMGGSKKSAPLEPMRFKGLLNLTTTGTITDNQAVLAPFDLFLKPGPQSAMAQRPVQPISWGVYNWTSKPKLTWEDRVNEAWVEVLDGQQFLVRERTPDEYVDTQISSTVPDVIINPNLDMTLISKKVLYLTGAGNNVNYSDFNYSEVDYHRLSCHGAGPFVPMVGKIERPFGSNVFTTKLYTPYGYMNMHGGGTRSPIAMALELTFRINGGVIHSDQEIKIIKPYPVEFNYTYKWVGSIDH